MELICLKPDNLYLWESLIHTYIYIPIYDLYFDPYFGEMSHLNCRAKERPQEKEEGVPHSTAVGGLLKVKHPISS